MKFDIQKFSELSFKNKSLIELDKNVSCYYCQRTYLGKLIKEWVDENEGTALCPFCEIDSVVPFEVNKETLKEATEFWFDVLIE